MEGSERSTAHAAALPDSGMARRVDHVPDGQCRGRGRERSEFTFLRPGRSASSGYSKRLVGGQEVQLYGLSPASSRAAFDRTGSAVLSIAGHQRSVAAATDE